MNNNWTHERRSRRADAIQWDGSNTDAVLERLVSHGMIGEVTTHANSKQYLTIRANGYIVSTLRHSDWAYIGEDDCLRFEGNDEYVSKYQPIDDELYRLRAFAREVLALECPGRQRWQKESIAEKHGITIESLKEPA